MNEKFFAGIQQTPADTSAGPCAMPILYYDAGFLGLFYRVDVARANAVLEAAGVPFEVFPVFGKALILLANFEYRDTTVGAYGEIGLAIQCRRKGTNPGLAKFVFGMESQEETGLYVVNLPVTTEAACAAGRELWGYPKYVTGIESEFRDDGCRIALEGEFELTHTKGVGLRMKGLPFITWTVHQGRMIRTVIPVGHKVKYGGASSVTMRLLGDGPTARSIEALGLHETRPSFAFRTDALNAILPFGKDMGAAPAASATPGDRRVA